MNGAATTLSEELVRALRPVVPRNVVIEVVPTGVQVREVSRTGTWSTIGVQMLVEQEGDLRELLRRAAEVVRSSVQDFIATSTREPWPEGNAACRPPRSSHSFVPAHIQQPHVLGHGAPVPGSPMQTAAGQDDRQGGRVRVLHALQDSQHDAARVIPATPQLLDGIVRRQQQGHARARWREWV